MGNINKLRFTYIRIAAGLNFRPVQKERLMKILSLKTTFALLLLVGVAFWAVDVSQAQLFRNPFPPKNARPPVDNVPPGGVNNLGGGRNVGNQGGNVGNQGGNVGNQGG